jgi:hypothetical protein
MEVKSVSTNAPLASTAVGYKKTFPIGFAVQAAIQRVWVLSSVNIAAELGYNVTAANSNESFTEVYLAAVARFSIGSDSKRPILKPAQNPLGAQEATNSENARSTGEDVSVPQESSSSENIPPIESK